MKKEIKAKAKKPKIIQAEREKAKADTIEKVREIVEGMKKATMVHEINTHNIKEIFDITGYNQALGDLLNKLKQN